MYLLFTGIQHSREKQVMTDNAVPFLNDSITDTSLSSYNTIYV